MRVEVIDFVVDYVELMELLFDFSKILELLRFGKFKMCIDLLYVVIGFYVKNIFE